MERTCKAHGNWYTEDFPPMTVEECPFCVQQRFYESQPQNLPALVSRLEARVYRLEALRLKEGGA